MKYQYIFIDFDGTIADTSQGIINCIHHAFKKLGLVEAREENIKALIGPPLPELFRGLLGEVDNLLIEECVKIFRERYSEVGRMELSFYPDIIDLLKSLHQNGTKLYIITTKPQIYVDQIVEHFNIGNLFTYITGTELGMTKTQKTEQIERTMTKFGISKENVVMVGDRPEDIIAAVNNGIDSIGIAYGFGKEEELTKAGATYIAGKPSEINHFL